LANPGTVGKVLDDIVGADDRNRLLPDDGAAHLAQLRVPLRKNPQHFAERMAGVDEVVDQQPAGSGQLHRRAEVLADPDFSLLPAALLPVGAGEHHAERPVEDPREHVAHPQPAPGEADDGIEVPPRIVDLEGEPLDEPAVLAPADVEVSRPRASRGPGGRENGCRVRMVSSRSGPVETMSIGAPATSAKRSM